MISSLFVPHRKHLKLHNKVYFVSSSGASSQWTHVFYFVCVCVIKPVESVGPSLVCFEPCSLVPVCVVLQSPVFPFSHFY